MFAQSAGRTDGMICTGRGSPYSMVAAAERAATGLLPAGARTKPCVKALARVYSIGAKLGSEASS